jgi:hypothetical protein
VSRWDCQEDLQRTICGKLKMSLIHRSKKMKPIKYADSRSIRLAGVVTFSFSSRCCLLDQAAACARAILREPAEYVGVVVMTMVIKSFLALPGPCVSLRGALRGAMRMFSYPILDTACSSYIFTQNSGKRNKTVLPLVQITEFSFYKHE